MAANMVQSCLLSIAVGYGVKVIDVMNVLKAFEDIMCFKDLTSLRAVMG